MADQGSGQQRWAGWRKDPSGRHFGRYWNGSQWTEHVISAEKVQSVDPLPPRPEPAILSEGAPPPAPTVQNAPVQPERPTVQWRGPAPTAPDWTPDARRLRGPGPVRPPEDDPRGKGANQIMAAVGGWPRWAKWAAGAAVGVVLIAVAASGGEDEDQPVSVVGQVETTLTLPVDTTVAPVTQAPTTEATARATTRAPATSAPATTAATAPATTAATAPATTPPAAVYYANCTAAKAAGAAPVHRSDPGYGSHLDRDNDGVGCET
jgi:hypothetical protein